MHKSKRTRQSSIPVRNNAHNTAQTRQTIYTTRSDSCDGEITTVRQSFKIIGSPDGDNRNSLESYCDSNKDSGFDGSQELLNQEDDSDSYSEVKVTKSVSFEDVNTNDSQNWVQPTSNIKVELEEEIGEDEEVLKEELLRIFDRERLTLGSFFKHKMEDLTREFKNKQIEMEKHSRAERAEMENDIAEERAEMQKSFADEIAALTHTFNEERANLEQYYKDQLKELREKSAEDQNEMDQKLAREKTELQEKLEAEFQAMLRAEIADMKQSAMQEANRREERHSMEKLEMERKHNLELTEAEMNAQKIKTELEMMFAQEKMRLESDLRETINDIETQLKKETEKRNELEKYLQQEKVNGEKLESEKRNENEKFKTELEGLKIELEEKNRSSMEMRKVEEEIRVRGKDSLSGRLREDFDKMVDDYKMELERNYQTEKKNLQRELEYECQAEKERIQKEFERERKNLMEEIAKERDDMEQSRKQALEEQKAKNEERFSRENKFKYDDDYSRNGRGIHQNEGWVKEQDYDEDDYRPALDSTRKNRYQNGYNSENSGSYDAVKYSSPSYRQTVCKKIQNEYENPSRIEKNESRSSPHDFSKQRLVRGERDVLPNNREAPDYKGDFFYVTPGNENTLRSEINELRRENEGLKAQIEAMNENIDLHRKYKAEAKEELSRLQKSTNELQSQLDDKDKEQADGISAKNKVNELEERLRNSEAKRKEFEDKIQELNIRLNEVENKSKPEKEKAYQLDDNFKERHSIVEEKEPAGMPKDRIETCYTSPLYHEPISSQYDKEPVSCRYDKNESISGHGPESQDNVYGYPSETKVKSYESRYSGDTKASNYRIDSYQSSIDACDVGKSEYSDRFKTTVYPRVTRPDLYPSHRASSPIYGSHSGQSRSSWNKTGKPGEKYKPGRYSSFEVTSDPYFDTSSPRALINEKCDKDASLHIKDSGTAKKQTNYEKAVAEREKLIRLIKELKERVKELEKEKERIEKEEDELRHQGRFDNLYSSHLPSENATLKLKVDEMQKKINVLAERLKPENPEKRPHQDEKPKRKPYSMEQIESLQGKLQRTGDVIEGSSDNLDPDVLKRIEKEIKSIGEFIRSHYYEETQGGSSYRSANDPGKVLQLQSEKQELEMKLNLAKEAMSDYVNRLSDKVEDMQEINSFSDSTLQELYERNASLKETLRALEKGQHKSQIQNEELKHQKSALQNLIEQLCKPNDVSFGSQFSSPRHYGKGGDYDYTMTSQVHYKIPKLEISDRFSS